MSKKNDYKNVIVIADHNPPIISYECSICGGSSSRSVLCDNCRKILREFVQNHKSNWGTDK